MNRRRTAWVSALLLAALGTAGRAHAQDQQTSKPITSLPRAPGETTPVPTPVPAGIPATTQPDYVPVPITSLPKAPTPASPPPSPVPAVTVAPEVTPPLPSPAPASTPAALEPTPAAPQPAPPVAEPAPQPAAPVAEPAPQSPQPAQPASAPNVLQPITSAPAPAAPLPEPPPPPPSALHASTLGATATTLPVRPRRDHIRPFSAVAIQLKAGFAGAGIDLAVPVLQRVNFRVGGSFFQYSGSYDIDGMTINGEVKFRSGTANIDIFPFGNSFRISPGVTLYNGNNINATTNVPGGQNFDLGDGTYQSAVNDPVHGTASMTFGKRTAPNLTVGFGNMIPRHAGRHWSVPFEIGVQYVQNPQITFDLQGTVCDPRGCAQIQTDPTAQADLKQEQTNINNDIHFLRFYPIMSIGVGYRFGGGHSAERLH